MKIIVPAAGLSSRFPGMRPKYLLYDYKHKLMLQNALQSYSDYEIYVGILREHDEQFGASKYLRYEFGSSINIIVLDKQTTGPADTVYQILNRAEIDDNSSILIKDCDSFFEHEITEGNYVCVSNIKHHDVLKKIGAKSFVIQNEQNIITDIVEKNIVSETFCVGGYKFRSAGLYRKCYSDLSSVREVFVSDVIQRCLHSGEIFTTKSVSNYYDVGTAQDWFEYNDKAVLFCDIDGTIVMAQPKHDYSNVVPLESNIRILLEKQRQGYQFVFTTARSSKFEILTRSMLDNFGFTDYQLVMNLQNSRRILINDYNTANPYPRAEAINIRRDSDSLSDFL
jgi:hypothetical protein